jgi:hypothetical protein
MGLIVYQQIRFRPIISSSEPYDPRNDIPTLIPAIASQCQTLPASAGHSHSIVNKPFFHIKSLTYFSGKQSNTMKNTISEIP